MIRRYPRAPVSSSALKIIVHANSLGFGAGTSSTNKRWPSVMNTLAPLAGKGISISNVSVAGMGIVTNSGAGTMTATAPSSVDPLLDPAKLNVLFIHEFINELKGNSNNVNAAMSAWAAYCQARRTAAANAGAKLFIVTMTTTPAGAAPAGQGQSWVDARMAAIRGCNESMRRNYRGYADLLIDMAAVEPFASMYAANVWTPAAFQASGLWAMSDGSADDYTHFGDSGYALMAAVAARAIPRIRKV
jgi:hypothetical protein